MPDNRLKSFRMGRGMYWVDRGYDHAGVGNGGRIAAIAPYDSRNFRTYLLGKSQRRDEIRADILFEIAAAYRKYQQSIFGPQAADGEPGLEDARPTFVIGASCQFGNVVGGSVRLDTRNLPEIIDGVRCIRSTPTHP